MVSSLQSSHIIEENSTKPVVLTKVDVKGGQDFSDNFFNTLLAPTLYSSDSTLNQLNRKLQNTTKSLAYTEVFNGISVTVDPASPAEVKEGSIKSDLLYSSVNADSKAIPVKATIELAPKKLKTYTLSRVQNEDGQLFKAGVSHLNCFGNAERFDFEALLSQLPENLGRAIKLNYKAPTANTSVKLFVQGDFSNLNQGWTSHKQVTTSGMFGLEKIHGFTCSSGYAATGVLSGGLSVSKKSITDINDAASDTIKINAGDSVKESLVLNGLLDSRKFLPSSGGLLPTSGSLLNFNTELGGLSSASKFIKTSMDYQLNYSILSNWFTLSSEFGLGAIKDLSVNKTSSNIHFSDKFYLGGENSIPGFQKNGIAFNPQGAIGGNFFWKCNFTLLSKVLFAPSESPLRLFAKISAGDLYNNISYSREDGLRSKPASSASFGLVYKVSNTALLNLHVNTPISDRTKDLTKPGIGFSLALTGAL